MPEISVIIPVYNVEKYLRECLDSILAQTFTDWEAICVNDGATDSSPVILAEYAAKDPRFKIVNRKNGGLSAARNTGVANASGKYIYFIDSDDMITPDALQWMYDTVKEHKLDILHFAWEVFYEPDVPDDPFENRNFFNDTYGEICSGPELFAHMNKCNDWSPTVVARLFCKEFYSSARLAFHEGILHEDESFSLIADLSAQKVMRVNKICYRRRVRAGSIMTGSSAARHFTGCLTAYDDIADFVSNSSIDKAALEFVNRRMACLLISAKRHLPDEPDEQLLQKIADAEKFIAAAELADERNARSFMQKLFAPLICLKENGLRYTLKRIFKR